MPQRKGRLKGYFSVTVPVNWRIMFTSIDGNAQVVNYEKYPQEKCHA